MILTGDPILDDIRYLSIESGISFLSFSPPFSPAEINFFLDSIDENSLSSSGRDTYYKILRRITPLRPPLSYSSRYFSAYFNINSTIEGTLRFNSDISWISDDSNIIPMVSFPVQLFFANTVQLYIEPTLSKKPGKTAVGLFDTNIITDSYHFGEQYWAFKSFFATGGSWWNFQIGRDNLYWGSGHTGSMIFSNDSTFFDFARLSFFSPHVKYSIIVNHMPLILRQELFEDLALVDWTQEENLRSINRYFYLHRLDVKLFNRVSIAVMEGIMAGNSPLEIRFLNPMIIFHTLYAWQNYINWEGSGDMVGSFFSVELNWNIIRNLSVYGQFVMNQLAIPGEISSGSPVPPNALGYLAGINFSHSFKNWNSLFFVEFIYTDPYLNILSSPFASFIQEDFHYYLISHSRDTISLTAGTEFFNNSSLRFSARFSWIASGELNKNGLKWSYESTAAEFNRKTPSGTAEHKFILSFFSQWQPYSWLEIKAGIAGIFSQNNNNNPGENALGGQIQISVGFKY